MKLRPVADVTRDLIRLYTPKSEREPEPKRTQSGKVPQARPFDFRRLKVLDRRDHGDVSLITVALSASDVILAGVAIVDTLTLHAMSPGAAIARPIIERDGEPAMVLRVQNPPDNLAVGQALNVSALFGVDSTFGEPAIVATVTKLRVRSGREPGAGVPITLPVYGTRPPLTDEDIGLKPSPGDQARAEAFIRAAIGYRLHLEDKAREAARLAAAERLMPGPTIHTEVPDDAVTLIRPTDQLDATDKAILAEMQRIAAMGLPRWMRPTGAAA